MRETLLVLSAVMLGWTLNNLWRDERERLIWRAADRVREQEAFTAQMRQRSPDPDLEPAAGTT